MPLTEKVFLLSTSRDEDGVSIAAADVRPDVKAARTGGGGAPAAGAATLAPPLRVPTVMPVRVPHVTVEIREAEHRRLVTVIEVLSPTNKRGGRREYVRKRRRLLLSPAHLMEIDLLRAGRRVPMRATLPDVPYFVFLSRAEDRPFTGVWPIRPDGRLPKVPVPFLSGDSAYDGFSYDLTIDYARPSRVPLGPEEAAWAQERVRAWRAAEPGE